jgi:hypothetical protein
LRKKVKEEVFILVYNFRSISAWRAGPIVSGAGLSFKYVIEEAAHFWKPGSREANHRAFWDKI